MANRLRGEVEIQLFGKAFTLCPDHQSILEIEDVLADREWSVPYLFKRVIKGTLPVAGIAGVIVGCLKGQGIKDYSFDAVSKEIRKVGITTFVPEVAKLLTAMVTAEEVQADEKKSEPGSSPGQKVDPGATPSTGSPPGSG